MKKLVLYSDDREDIDNRRVDLELVKLIGKDNPRIGYIPSISDINRRYFNKKLEYYKQYNIKDLFYFDLDQEYDDSKTGELLECDAIHLSGGNTYYFLNSLKKRDFTSVLQNYVTGGGVLIGVSAGAIMMAKTINSTTIYREEPDENRIGLRDFSALGLVEFEFFPHLNQKEEYLDMVKRYSKENGVLVYACRDGDGIVVDNKNIKLIGGVVEIQNGEVINKL